MRDEMRVMIRVVEEEREEEQEKNKAGYTAQDAPSTRLKITQDGRTYGWTYGPTDRRMDTPSYRDAWTHLKMYLKMLMS